MKKDWRLISVILVLGVMASGCFNQPASTMLIGCMTWQAYDFGNDSLVAEVLICADSSLLEDSTYLQTKREFDIQYRNTRITEGTSTFRQVAKTKS